MALKTDLISLWSMNETSGTRADSHGSITLADPTSVGSTAGKYSQNAAVFVSSSSNRLTAADSASLSFGNESFAISCWIRLQSLASQNFVTKWNNSSNLREFRFHMVGSKFQWEVTSNPASAGGTVDSASFPSTGVWYWVYMYHDAASDVLGISVDNGTPSTTSYSLGCNDSTSEFWVGGRASGSTYADAHIQQVAIWRGLKSTDDRTAIYNSGNGLAYASWDAGGFKAAWAAQRRSRIIGV